MGDVAAGDDDCETTPFETDVNDVFGSRARDFSPDLRALLQALWNAAFERGITRSAERYEAGCRQGRKEIEVLFANVLRGRSVHEVLRMGQIDRAEGRLEMALHPWVVEAFQKILDEPTLVSESPFKDEHSKVENSDQAFGLTPECSVGKRIGDHLFSDPGFASLLRPSAIVEESP